MSSTKYAYLLWHISLWLFFLLLCIFCISLTSPLLWEYTQLVCASAQLFLGFCIENEGRSGRSHSCQWQPWGSRALEILSKDSETDGNEHVALNRRVHCSSNFQFRKQFGKFQRPEQEPESSDVANIREELEKKCDARTECVSSWCIGWMWDWISLSRCFLYSEPHCSFEGAL